VTSALREIREMIAQGSAAALDHVRAASRAGEPAG
jgi:hypothetical protein